MSLHALATHMAQTGRGPDSMLVHMSPREVESLQALAKANGGSLTINPQTGLPEAGFLDSLLPIAAGFLLGPAGFGIASSALGAGAIVGGITTLATGSLQKGLMAGFGAYGGAGLGAGLAGVGESALGTEAYNTAMANAIEPGLEGMTQQEFVQQSVADRIKDATPWDKLSTGFENVTSSPSNAWDFAKNNGQSLLAATSPILAGSGVQTTTSAPQTPSYYRPFMYDPQTQGLQALTPVSGKGIKEGGLTGLCGGGAVAFADGGGINMFSPYVDLLAHPEKSNIVAGAERDAYMKDIQAKQDELNQRMIDRQTVGGGTAQPINWQQSPSGLNPSITQPIAQTNASAQGDTNPSGFTVGGGSDGTAYGAFGGKEGYDKAVAAETARKAAENATRDAYQISPDSPFYAASKVSTGDRLNNLKDQAYQFDQQQKNRAGLAAAHPGEDFSTVGPDMYPKATSAMPSVAPSVAPSVNFAGIQNTPTPSGAPNVPAAGIQTLTSPDKPATTTAAPSGIQMVHGSIYDPATGRFRNPTEAELGTQALRGMRDNVNTVSEMTQLTNQYFDSYKPGEVLDFAGGTLTKNADGTATHTYKDTSGRTQSYTFTKGTDIATIAKSDPAIASEWKNMFNYTAPTTNTGTTPGTVPPVITPPNPTYPSVPTPGSGGPGTSTTRPFDWQNVPIDRLPTVTQKKPEDAMSGESLAAYNALFGKGSTATKQWDTYPGRNYLPNTDRNFFIQRDGVVTNSNTATTSPSTTTQFTNPRKPPTEDPGEGNIWAWDGTKWFKSAITTSANGGLMGYAAGGLGSLGGYSDGGRLLKGPGDGVSDSIPASIGDRQPARLADGEFVVPARIVSELGNGSTEAGARRLYQMMDRVQHARKKSVGKGNVAKNTRAEQYLPA